MASPSLLLLFLISLPFAFTFAQDSTPSTPGPDMVECQSHLLPLAPCAPFVQGSVSSPAQPCCHNLIDLYDQQPSCFCILLNDTTLSSFPINKTLALQLPLVCNLEINFSSCPGFLVPPSTAEPQVSHGTSTNSSTAVSPSIALAPRSNMGLLFGRSTGAKLKVEGGSLLLVATAFLLMEVFSLF